MLDLVDFETSAAFTDDERLVLRLARAMTVTPARVDDNLWISLRIRFDEPQLVELASVIALENYRARFNRCFAIESQGFD